MMEYSERLAELKVMKGVTARCPGRRDWLVGLSASHERELCRRSEDGEKGIPRALPSRTTCKERKAIVWSGGLGLDLART